MKVLSTTYFSARNQKFLYDFLITAKPLIRKFSFPKLRRSRLIKNFQTGNKAGWMISPTTNVRNFSVSSFYSIEQVDVRSYEMHFGILSDY